VFNAFAFPLENPQAKQCHNVNRPLRSTPVFEHLSLCSQRNQQITPAKPYIHPAAHRVH
jgi:hypothetical protein